jgi:hypothetical protein
VPGKTGLILLVGTHGDIVMILKVLDSFRFEIQALAEATEGEPLMLFIEAVGSTKKTAGSEGPTVLIEPAINESLLG